MQFNNKYSLFPIKAGERIEKGHLICIDKHGFVKKFTTSDPVQTIIGVANQSVDNSFGKDGDKDLSIIIEGFDSGIITTKKENINPRKYTRIVE